jgi:hypothetical protein
MNDLKLKEWKNKTQKEEEEETIRLEKSLPFIIVYWAIIR